MSSANDNKDKVEGMLAVQPEGCILLRAIDVASKNESAPHLRSLLPAVKNQHPQYYPDHDVSGDTTSKSIIAAQCLISFKQREIREARQYALSGGQALHIFDGRIADLIKTAPRCFKKLRYVAHLFDQDKARLVKTAKRLGVRVIKIDHENTPRQHIDLCRKPLERAIHEAKPFRLT